VVGFTASVSLSDLVSLGRRRGLPIIDDIGSGALVNLGEFGLAGEPSVSDSIREGADVVLFSGDKLLGGPQCGIILGKQEFVERIEQHPMTRALRVDKITLAALAATLRLYRYSEQAKQRLPLLRLLGTTAASLRVRAESMARKLGQFASIAQVDSREDTAFLGGGAVPAQKIPTWCVRILPASRTLDAFAHALRTCKTPIVGRIQQDRFILDLRTVFPAQDQQLVQAVAMLHEEKTQGNQQSEP